MKIRLDKLISNMGYGSRSEIKKNAKKGLIKVNNVIEKNSGKLVDTEEDIVKYKDETIEYRQFIYLLMNKPKGYISATEDSYHETVLDLLDDYHKSFLPAPIGRLDIDTEGLLLLSNDGKFNHELTSPKKNVPKTYYVELARKIEDDYEKIFKKGIKLMPENIVTKPAEFKVLTEKTCELTIYEGKFHQVKRMFEEVGNRVIYLKRIKMGYFELPMDLEPGEYIELREEEIKL
ncbi:pseudouridine synthase [Miniphocaeibacter halophilus]|uniref:rRNA pseudouridine synthase n=1 Tax=Miniphocaeibacter halophilus TaxID=2931922 RepID=A0AC61MS54_9FIRM|nr:pseudouridine synthase [Miniphocaeibacter halophilus]QQK08469.1 rRNA pseudouridine synthase [Miniphocaeibacter halophilus]